MSIATIVGIGKGVWAFCSSIWKGVTAFRGRNELRNTLIREIANNYECVEYETKQTEDFQTMVNVFRNRLEFIAFKARTKGFHTSIQNPRAWMDSLGVPGVRRMHGGYGGC